MNGLLLMFGLGSLTDDKVLKYGSLALLGLNCYLQEDTTEEIKAWKKHFLSWAFGNEWDRLPESYYIWMWNKRHGAVLPLNEKDPLEKNLEKMTQRFNFLYY